MEFTGNSSLFERPFTKERVTRRATSRKPPVGSPVRLRRRVLPSPPPGERGDPAEHGGDQRGQDAALHAARLADRQPGAGPIVRPRPLILVDSREQTPLRFSSAVDVQRATLPTGDYSVAGATDRVTIERKSLADLVACCTTERERFLDCCRRLRDYETRAIVVEASLSDVLAGAYRSKTNPSSVVGTVLAIHVDYGVPTLWAVDAKTAATVVERLLVRVWSRRQRDPDPTVPLVAELPRHLHPYRPEGSPDAA